MGSLNTENTAKQDLDDSGCVQDASEGENSRNYAQLLDLSDDVLLCILQYLTPRDLKALGHTCPRLGVLICDRTLWTKVDARTAPMGQERLKWFLTHCLSPATTELKIAGYANKFSRCLGIQDLHWPVEADQDFIRGTCVGSQEGVDVEHFLLRMWYPHLPRFAVSPRWPDNAEAEIKTAKAKADKKAEEAAASKSEDAVANGEKPGSSVQTSSSFGPNSQKSNSSGSASFSDLKAGSSGHSSRNSGPNSNKSDQNGDLPGPSGENGEYFESWSENMDEYPSLFEDDIRDDCRGPQFTLTKRLMRDLTNTCSNLTSLSLEYCNIDYRSTNLRHFPFQLKKLSLRGSRIYNLPLNTSYLGKVQERLPELEYLDVSECDWFEPASLMPLSKLPNLTELYMRDCKRLTECVAYASLATRYGFRRLRVFDVRGSPLADSEVSALGWLPLLEELYVSPPEDFSPMTEHTHSWSITDTPHNELDAWEQEEPDYYKIKSPEPEYEPEDREEEPDERHGDVMFSNPWWSHERRIIVIQPNANRQLEEHYPLMQRQPPNAAEENWVPQPPTGFRIPRHAIEEVRLPGGIPLPPMHCLPGSIDIVPGDLIPRLVRQPHVPQEPPRPGPVNPKPVPTDPRDDTLLRQGTAVPKADLPNQRPNARPANQESGPSNLQAGPAMYRPSSMNIHPCPPHPNPRQSTACPQFSNLPPTYSAFQGGPAFYRPGPANPQAGPSNLQPGPTNPQAGTSYTQPGPANPQPGPANPQPGPADPQPGTSYSLPGPANPEPGPGNQQPGSKKQTKILLGATIYGPDNLHATVRYHERPEAGPSNPQPGTSHPQAGYSNQRPAPSNAQAGPSNPQPGPSNQQPGTSHPQAGPSNSQPGTSHPQAGYSNQRPAPSNAQAGPSKPGQDPSQPQPGSSNQAGQNAEKRRSNINDAMDLAKRRRVEEKDEEMKILRPIPPNPANLRNHNTERCPRLRLEDNEDHVNQGVELHRHPAYVRFRRRDLRPIMHIDVDLDRQSTLHLGAHVGYNLVSDSAILRFGRAENENVNYVHIGRNGIHHGSESGSRPDRSNLRILSVTGYRNITDRSLQHLVTAAPYLLHIDFSETSVTPRGVELFRAVRPECEVIYSEFNRQS